jgi:methylmalonyl-CoA mutase N-terminal domain/subunit
VATYETGCSEVVDPLAGSYYLEHLTCEIEEKIWEELERIDKKGGAVKCIEDGYFHKTILEDSYKWQKQYDRGEVIRVGVNAFKTDLGQERPMNIFRTDFKEEDKRKLGIAELRKKRDNKKVKKALDEVKATASLQSSNENNLVLPVIEAAKCYATVGEVCDALREIWGEYREPRMR